MELALIVAEWKRRLVEMAENPPYVFRDTPRELIEQEQRRLTTFLGYSEAEVAEAQVRLGVRFPAVFRDYLLRMGRSHEDLFRGSNVAGIEEFEKFRADALALMAETDPDLSLPQDAVVFLFNQGYTFLYLRGDGEFDGPLLQHTETEHESPAITPLFADVVDAELRLMESNDATARERGGYYVTLHTGGGATESYPALSSGNRPLDRAVRQDR